jgi:hypothetical protein
MTLERKILSMALQLLESADVINEGNLVIYHLHTEFYMTETMFCGTLKFTLLISSITDVCKKKYFPEFYTQFRNSL